MRRVVVTGMGIACPLGVGVEHVWRRLINGESGIGAIQAFDTKDLPCKVAGQVPPGVKADGGLDISEWIPVKDQKKMDRFIHLAMVAGTRGGRGFRLDAGNRGRSLRHRRDDRLRHRRPARRSIEASILVHEGKARRLSPFFIPSALINLASGHVSIKYGFKGPNHSVVTACATGVHAIGDAARLIMLGRRRRDGRRRRRGRGLRTRHRRVLRLARAVHRLQRHARRPHRARGTRTATAS